LQLLSDGKVFVEFVLAFCLSIGFQLRHARGSDSLLVQSLVLLAALPVILLDSCQDFL
jgi:hypothetical protein